ncbi:MAG TPA: 16S rRNA (uracil(1498)-N(3))-methyltransferase [Gammaproteobacteria bacterium]|nr:16S rRNA (uracil(1498)-N(3))-methyltransferase [Gammaproteobacteria bacterium]
MRIARLYIPGVSAGGETITVTGQAAHHAIQVLRLRPGAVVRVFNGKGPEWEAVLLEGNRTGIRLEVGIPVNTITEPSLSITLAQGIARNDRMDFILQKSVELGISAIQPLWTQRCQTRLGGERLGKRLAHWQGVIISACEQCGRSTLPELHEPEKYPAWVNRQSPACLRLMLQPHSAQTLHDLPQPESGIIILVGPEGGLNTGEQQLGKASGFTGIRLGQRVLRTETAALTALAGMHTLWGDFLGNDGHAR